MRNPYTIRAEKNLYFILSEASCANVISHAIQRETLVVMNLYYSDTAERYFEYLDTIPQDIQIRVISSVNEVLESGQIYAEKKRLFNVKFLKKENRGRDISAFLVAYRKEILNYKYFCFVHDKKANYEYFKEDVDLWIENLWTNTLASTKYISNVLDIFEKNAFIGLLVPPEPIGEYLHQWYTGSWGKNYEHTKELADRLEIKCCMDPKVPVITLGTAFWCRVEALRKLFQIEWQYEDFEDEPLPLDGSLSHSIERILSFVAQDAGYETGTVMCEGYAQKLISRVQDKMHEMYTVYNYFEPEYSLQQLKELMSKTERLKSFFQNNKKVYLYGAGKVGNYCLNDLRKINCEPAGFVVSKKNNDKRVNGLEIKELDEISNDRATGIIVTVGKRYYEEIVNYLESIDFKNYISYLY